MSVMHSMPEELHGRQNGNANGDHAAQTEGEAQFHFLHRRSQTMFNSIDLGIQPLLRLAQVSAHGGNLGPPAAVPIRADGNQGAP